MKKKPIYTNKKKRMDPKKKKEEVEDSVDNEIVDFVYGRHAVIESLKAGRGNKLFLQEDLTPQKANELKDLAVEHSVPIQWVPKSKLELLTDKSVHQGMVLGVSQYKYLSLDELLEKVKEKREDAVLLILDGLEDPHNLGSILRTADATGIDGVIIPKHRSVGITSIVAKTSTGAVEYIPIARVTNLVQTVKTLKEQQYWIFGTDMQGNNYQTWNTTGKIALIIGNEGKGMSPLLKKEVDELLTIPMVGHVQSLNASVAAGILMYEIFRNRSV